MASRCRDVRNAPTARCWWKTHKGSDKATPRDDGQYYFVAGRVQRQDGPTTDGRLATPSRQPCWIASGGTAWMDASRSFSRWRPTAAERVSLAEARASTTCTTEGDDNLTRRDGSATARSIRHDDPGRRC